ncbi:MAG: DUF192 domain-containing protein [Firmicutes bacterium]|jgi:uncharacterized membrane protein (UPF0127 family)|nr:DUF192 domain-containing protein [Bacillota bacterium]
MRKAEVYNKTQKKIILDEAEIADRFFLRLKGLLGRRGLMPRKGIIIMPCRSVHTLGMLFPIDLAFVNGDRQICYLIEAMKPNRISPVVKEACCVIEAPAGTFNLSGTKVGDEVSINYAAG